MPIPDVTFTLPDAALRTTQQLATWHADAFPDDSTCNITITLNVFACRNVQAMSFVTPSNSFSFSLTS